jgi:hypothetical protein
MEHDLQIVLQAMRRAQAKIAFYLEPGNGDPQKAFAELAAILDDAEVGRAVQALQSSGPSLAPDSVAEAERALHRALPGS